jgi:hypothetical protein
MVAIFYYIFQNVILLGFASLRTILLRSRRMASFGDTTKQVDALKKFFASQADRFQLIDGDVKSGMFGVCVKVKEKFADGRPERSFILKRPLNGVDPGMDLEIRRLAVRFLISPTILTGCSLMLRQEIQGGMHIVQQVVVENAPWDQRSSSVKSPKPGQAMDPFSVNNTPADPKPDNPPPDSNPDNTLLGPTVLLQLLENGTLKEFITKAKSHGQVLPNRLLWRFFLCRK